MYGLLYECKFLTIEETNNKKKNRHVYLSARGMSHEGLHQTMKSDLAGKRVVPK
jgi:hypothetical protein